MSSYLKAITAALVAGLGSLYQALDNETVTAQEWVAVALATLAALGAVYGVPNKDPEGRHQAESVQPPERGATTGELVLIIIGVVAVVFLVVLVVSGGSVRL